MTPGTKEGRTTKLFISSVNDTQTSKYGLKRIWDWCKYRGGNRWAQLVGNRTIHPLLLNDFAFQGEVKSWFVSIIARMKRRLWRPKTRKLLWALQLSPFFSTDTATASNNTLPRHCYSRFCLLFSTEIHRCPPVCFPTRSFWIVACRVYLKKPSPPS